MNTQYPVHDYLNIAWRRKWFILVPIVLGIAISFVVYQQQTPVYEAEAIVVEERESMRLAVDRRDWLRPEVVEMIRERLQREDYVVPVAKIVSGDETSEEVDRDLVRRVRRAFDLELFGDLLYFKAFDSDPHFVAKVANSYAEHFVAETRSRKVGRSGQYATFYDKELAEKKESLKAKDEELARFSSTRRGSLPEDIEMHRIAITRLSSDLARAQIDLDSRRAERENFLNALPPVPQGEMIGATVVPEGEDPVVRLRTLEAELAELRLRFKEKHPDVVGKVREIEATKARIAALPRPPGPGEPRKLDPASIGVQNYNRLMVMDREISRLEGQVAFTRGQIRDHEYKISLANNSAVEWATLQRERDALSSEYRDLLEEAKRSSLTRELTEDLQGDTYQLLERADVPTSPVSPNPKKFLVMGFVIGTVIGIGALMLMESLDQTYKSAEELTRDLGIPVVATIIRIEEIRKMPRGTTRRKAG